MTAVIRAIVLAAVAVALAAVGLWAAAGYLRVDDVRLPDLRGVHYEQATARLRDAGMTPVTYPELDARAEPDTVVSQTPVGGTVVRSGRTVRLGVNAASEAPRVPTLVGLPEREAVGRAESVAVTVGRVSYVASDRPAGTVVEQDPEPGVPVAPGQVVHLSVSRGRTPAPITLPDLRGMTLEAAERELEALGVRQVDAVAAALSFDRPLTVTDQRPAPGTDIVASTPVTLVYALEGTRIVRVPDVVGEPLWRAQLELRAARLAIGAVRQVDDPTRPAGVVEIRPDGYTVAGSPVALVVNGPTPDLDRQPLGGFDDDPLELGGQPGGRVPDDGQDAYVPAPGTTVVQPDGSRVIPFRFDPAQVGIASLARDGYQLTLVVVDDRGERTVLDRQLGAGESVVTSVQVYGDEPLLQTFVNGSFFQAWRP